MRPFRLRLRLRPRPVGLLCTRPLSSSTCATSKWNSKPEGELKAQQNLRGLSRQKPSEHLGLTVGSVHHGFRVDGIQYIKDFDMTAYHMQHERTKATYLHIDCADTNNVFSVVFRTPPKDSTGISHILEHCVLCGSEKYPVRDPFFNMLKRSLNTFMNAMTASDHTMYPFATQNAQDFRNLLGVYLDATFFPLLRENDFLQEGHRLEFVQSKPPDYNESDAEISEGGNNLDLTRSGVVYNEMKGTLGNSSTLFQLGLQRELFPETPYAHISGGDPVAIPNLTFEDLKAYHKRHYHPSNALFYTYGDLNVLGTMKTINDDVLQRFDYSPDSHHVKLGLLENIDVSVPGVVQTSMVGPSEALGEIDKQAKFCMVKDLGVRTVDEYEGLVLRLLGTLLMDGLNSPIYQALINSQLAPDYAPGSGCDTSLMKMQFGIGVQGISRDNSSLDLIKNTVQDTLKNVAETGFESARVEAALHQIELALKHKQTHFGLMVMYAASNTWTHGVSIEDDPRAMESLINESISVNNKLKRLKEEIADNHNFWQDKIRQYLLNDDRREVHLLMIPDEDFVRKLQEKEERELKDISMTLDKNEIEVIRQKSMDLENEREVFQDPTCLPTLSVSDIPRKPSEVVKLSYVPNRKSRDLSNDANFDWLSFVELEESTNDVAYVSLLFDAHELALMDLRAYLPIFGSLIGNVDTKDFTYQELAVESELCCGGMGFNTIVANWLGSKERADQMRLNLFGENDSNYYRQGVMLSVHCLERNLDRTLDLVTSTICGSLFGNDIHHLEALLSTTANNAINSVSSDALSYGRKWGLVPFGEQHALQELLSGLTQVELTLKIAELAYEGRLKELVPVLQAIANIVFRPENMRVCVVAGGNKTYIQNSLEGFTSRFADIVGSKTSDPFPSIPFKPAGELLARKFDTTYIPIDIPVHSCHLALQTGVNYEHPDSAAMTVLSQILSSLYLHREIREKGGAYGSDAGHLQSGILQMSSFYDPNTMETLNAYGNGIEWLCKGEFSSRDVDEAIISVFGSVDSPKSPASKGTSEFLHGLFPEDRQRYRDRFFELNKDKLVEAANKHLSKYCNLRDDAWTNGQFENGSVCIIGSRESCPDKQSSGNWTVKETL